MGKPFTCNETNGSSSLPVSTEQFYIVDGQGKKRLAIQVICDGCGSLFLIPKRFVGRSKKHYCSMTCPGRNNHILITCAYCKQEFYCRPAKVKAAKTGLLFCKRQCKDAAQRLTSDVNLRPTHYGKLGRYTLGELKEKTSLWRVQIGNDARRVASYLKGDCCEICGYKVYTEVCHLKGVAEFDDDSLISTINSENNLVVLCPNHHKELDMGLLKIGRGSTPLLSTKAR